MKLACISTLLVLGLVYAVYCEEGEKSNIFAVRVLPGTDVHALASKHRMSFKRRAFHDDSIILLEAPHINHEPNFHMNSDITWFERQTLVTRVKKQVLNAEWSDPQYPLQFHLRDDAFDQDINVRGTWGNGDIPNKTEVRRIRISKGERRNSDVTLIGFMFNPINQKFYSKNDNILQNKYFDLSNHQEY